MLLVDRKIERERLPMVKETIPRLFTLRAMASRLKVPSDWLKDQAEAGTVPAISTGSGYLFSLLPTVEAVGKLAESTIPQRQRQGGKFR